MDTSRRVDGTSRGTSRGTGTAGGRGIPLNCWVWDGKGWKVLKGVGVE